MESVRYIRSDNDYGYGYNHGRIEVDHFDGHRSWRSMFQVPHGMPRDVATRRAIEYHWAKYGEHRADIVLRQECGEMQELRASVRRLEAETADLRRQVRDLKIAPTGYLG